MVKTKFFFMLLFSASTISLAAQEPGPEKINWPANYEPSKSKFYVHNEIEIKAEPELVWSILVDAIKWPAWYKGAKNVVLVNPDDKVLVADAVFRWETMGLTFQSTIRQFEPNRFLAWESRKKSIQGYHVWLIIPNEKGCKVITDESQNGWLTFFEKIFQGRKLKRLHDVWLSELKSRAENHQLNAGKSERH